MTFWLFAATITLSAFAMTSVATSAGVAVSAHWITRRLDGYAPAARAAILFRLRMLPALLASVVAFGIALPVFVAYEPRDSDEAVSRTLILIGAAGTALVLKGIWRAAAAWRATSAVRREWQANGRVIDGFDTPLPVFAIDEPFPTVAVIGVTRPALFVSEQVLRECTADEVSVMLRHEAAHVTVRDNLKRFLIRACPDSLPGCALDNISKAWSCAAEEAADAAAVAGRPTAAVDLADALIRVARLATPSAPALASAFYLGGSIESRVRRLISPVPAPRPATPFGYQLTVTAAVCLGTLIVATAPMLHQAMEIVVSLLP